MKNEIFILFYLRKLIIPLSFSPANLARGKPAFQSSVGWGGVPSRAVDGDANPVYNSGHCSHTGSRHGEKWLVIDLQDFYDVTTVKIWPRGVRTDKGT